MANKYYKLEKSLKIQKSKSNRILQQKIKIYTHAVLQYVSPEICQNIITYYKTPIHKNTIYSTNAIKH